MVLLLRKGGEPPSCSTASKQRAGEGPALEGCRHPRAEESLTVLRLIRSNSLSLPSHPPPTLDLIQS